MSSPRSRIVGTGELLRFFLDRERFPTLEASGVAFMAALLLYVSTSGRNGRMYTAWPSLETLALTSRLTVPTVRKWARFYEASGWLIVRKRRNGRRAAPNEYDLTPAAQAINPSLKVIEGGRK